MRMLFAQPRVLFAVQKYACCLLFQTEKLLLVIGDKSVNGNNNTRSLMAVFLP